MPTVDLAALSARYPGGIPEAETPRAEAALEDAEAAVRAEAGLAPADALPDALASLVLRVARREFSNPLGYGSETLADYTWRKDGAGAGTALTDDERAEVRRAMGYGDVVSVPLSHAWTTDDVQRITATDPSGRFTVWPDGGTP